MKKNETVFKVIFLILFGFALSVTIAGLTLIYATELYTQMTPDDQTAMMVITLVIALVFIVITAIGVAVFRDARKLGMNAWMWMLVAVFAPNGIGIIIYLVFRYNEKRKKRCFECNKVITGDFRVCPHCGASLGNKCPECDKQVELDWNVCPYCSHRLKE